MASFSTSSKRLNVHICELPKTSDSNLPKLPPNAKLCLRWRRSFQKKLLVSTKHPLTRFFLRSRAAVSFEKRRHGRSTFWWVVHPCSDLRFFWDILMTFVLLFLFLSVPYIIAFDRISKNSGPESWNPIYTAYIICIIDIGLNFITGFASTDGHEIFLDPILIVRHYVKGYFWIDLISSVPYVWFYPDRILPSGPGSNSYLMIPEFLPLLKILRLSTLQHYTKQMFTTCGISHAQEMIVWLTLLTSLIFHWSACLTYSFPYIAMHVQGIPIQNSDASVTKMEFREKPDWKIYLTYLHIGVSNLVGSSFIELDALGVVDNQIRCILLILGKGYMIYLIVIILQLVESAVEPELKYQRIMHQVKKYIYQKKLPKRLQDKLIAYYEYRFQGSYFKDIAISSTLSNHLNQEIIIHSSRGLLEMSTILHNLPRVVVASIMAVLVPVIYLEDDIIYKCDTEGECMYFIASGTVALITYYGKEICHVQDGGYFGESVLIFQDRRRLETAIALEVCELLRLDRRNFKRLFALKSDFYNRLTKAAKERVDKILELNKIYGDQEVQKEGSVVQNRSENSTDKNTADTEVKFDKKTDLDK